MTVARESVVQTRSRESWVDNLRVVLIAAVIVLHTATGYAVDFAGWYHDDELDGSGPMSTVLTVPGLLGGLFWLGPLFLVHPRSPCRCASRRARDSRECLACPRCSESS